MAEEEYVSCIPEKFGFNFNSRIVFYERKGEFKFYCVLEQ